MTMNSKVLVILLVMMMVPTTTSAFNCLSCDPFFFTRVRTLFFGEFVCSVNSLILAICPDLGLFLFDVVSDILNGITFIKEGNPIWGWSVLGVIFLPMTVQCAVVTVADFRRQSAGSWHKKLLILLLAPILAVILIPLVTVFYILHVIVFLALKCVRPAITSPLMNSMEATIGMFKLYEGVLEANFQAALGLFSFLAVQR